MGLEAGDDGRDLFAILGKVLFILAGSLVQVCTFEREKSFFSQCIPYHFNVFGGLMNWSLFRPAVLTYRMGSPLAQ